jgi:hypothetical protein
VDDKAERGPIKYPADGASKEEQKMNRFRPAYRQLTTEEAEARGGLIELAAQMEEMIKIHGKDDRQTEFALKALEECIMWCSKSISA